jgi:non-specific serine/threonine protein kinase
MGGPTVAAPGSVPAEVTRLVGRDREAVEVRQLLGRTRLLTLAGPGGCGKTRLAVRVARTVSDGVCWVELAALGDPDLVPQRIAAALGVPESPGRAITPSVIERLTGWHGLLVLDNCEHLVDACAAVADRLLGAVPELRLLATSREPLGVAGEAVWAVPALSLPDAAAPHREAVLASEAGRLFVDRASLSKPGFEVTAAAAAAIAELCWRLEGIPLALELAAARVRVLSVEQILERLEDRFRLLTGGGRGAPSRQQTLRATLDWSHDLLSDEERVLLRRLSVFAGGWTLGAAEQVASCELRVASPEGGPDSDLTTQTSRSAQLATPLARHDVLDGLTRLVDKSLVLVEGRDGSPRYRMLETIREYAFERLAGSGEADAASRRHAQFFLELGESAAPELLGSSAAGWLARLEVEHDNLRAALRWLHAHDPITCLRFAVAVQGLWGVRGHLTEGRRWLELALAPNASAPGALRCGALSVAGILARLQGDLAAARGYWEEGARIAKETGDALLIGWSNSSLGIAALDRGDLRSARAFYEESLAIAREAGHDHMMGESFNNLGEVARLEGAWGAARALYGHAVAAYKRAGHQSGVSASLLNLGAAACEAGDLRTAGSSFREGLTIARMLGSRVDISAALDGLGAVAAKRGAWTRAARLAGAAEALREAIGSELDAVDRAFRERSQAELRAALGEAALEAALAEGRAATLERMIEYALETSDTA